MGNEAEDKKNEDAKAAADAAKSSADSSSQDSKAKSEEKTYSQAEAEAFATERIAEHYKGLNAKLSENGIELAKLRPLETEVVTLRTTVTKLEDAADESELEGGAKSSPTHMEVIQMRRDLRTSISGHNENVRKYTIDKAALDADRVDYDAWNDNHNPNNPESVISVATKHKVDPKGLEGIPKEAREVIALKLAEVSVVPANPVNKEPTSPVDDGIGQGGEQLTGQAAARAALDKAKGITK